MEIRPFEDREDVFVHQRPALCVLVTEHALRRVGLAEAGPGVDVLEAKREELQILFAQLVIGGKIVGFLLAEAEFPLGLPRLPDIHGDRQDAGREQRGCARNDENRRSLQELEHRSPLSGPGRAAAARRLDPCPAGPKPPPRIKPHLRRAGMIVRLILVICWVDQDCNLRYHQNNRCWRKLQGGSRRCE